MRRERIEKKTKTSKRESKGIMKKIQEMSNGEDKKKPEEEEKEKEGKKR